MKKYYDAMYKAFYSCHNVWYRNKNVDYALKLHWVNELGAELCGVVDVACCDNEVSAGEEFDTLLNLRNNLCDIARVYFLAE